MDPYTLVLMAVMICREAPFEPRYTKLAVAQTVMNRVAHPSWWGSTPEGVIISPYQYSTMTAPGDKQLTTWPSSEGAILQECLDVAKDALKRKSPMVVKGADSFYAEGIRPPEWATEDAFVAKLGPLLFYNTDGK
jgi:spore germination cell wall hydrolase CwlJ-like protein